MAGAAPARLMDPIHLADWVEIRALTSPDKNASAGDLTTMLRTSAVPEDEGVPPDDLARDAFSELELRAVAAGEGYPFSINGPVLMMKKRETEVVPYLFCLLTSRLAYARPASVTNKVRKLFEELSAVAAAKFLDDRRATEGLVFGFPRTKSLRRFEDAVEHLIRMVGEGKGFLPGNTLDAKDDALDVVAWRDFPDMLPGKVILFGQCTTAQEWNEKLTELIPEKFAQKWIVGGIASPIVRAFFVPHRVESDRRWWNSTIDGGILFDRCRISYWAQGSVTEGAHSDWISGILRGSNL